MARSAVGRGRGGAMMSSAASEVVWNDGTDAPNLSCVQFQSMIHIHIAHR